MPRLLLLLFVVALILGFQTRAINSQKTCGFAPEFKTPSLSLPDFVSGRVAFYAAVYRDGILIPESAVALGDPSSVFPMESMHKTFVIHAAMRAVDAGALKLEQRFKTTKANQRRGVTTVKTESAA